MTLNKNLIAIDPQKRPLAATLRPCFLSDRCQMQCVVLIPFCHGSLQYWI